MRWPASSYTDRSGWLTGLHTIETCNLCGSGEFAVIAYADRYGHPIRTALCAWCGLVRLLDRYTPERYAEFYRSGEYRRLVSQYHGREISAATIQKEQAEYAKSVANMLAGHVNGGDLLDIGGSTGVVAAHVAGRFGMSATLVDPAADETAVAEQFGIATVNTSAEAWDTEQRFDCILLCQTIDHLLDPMAVLRKMRLLLKPGGVAFVDVLDFERVVDVKGIVGACKIDHPHNFTSRTATAYWRRVGFDVLESEVAGDHVAYVLSPTSNVGMGTVDAQLALGNLLAKDLRHQ